MSDMIRSKVRDACLQVLAAERLLEEGLNALSRARSTLSACEDILLDNSLDTLPPRHPATCP